MTVRSVKVRCCGRVSREEACERQTGSESTATAAFQTVLMQSAAARAAGWPARSNGKSPPPDEIRGISAASRPGVRFVATFDWSQVKGLASGVEALECDHDLQTGYCLSYTK
jgi:hypothetical protein